MYTIIFANAMVVASSVDDSIASLIQKAADLKKDLKSNEDRFEMFPKVYKKLDDGFGNMTSKKIKEQKDLESNQRIFEQLFDMYDAALRSPEELQDKESMLALTEEVDAQQKEKV